VQIPLLKAAFSSGYTYNSLKAVLAHQGVTIYNLPPLPPPEVGDGIPLGLGKHLKTDLGADLPEFSLGALHDYIVRFIVADDQVCYISYCDVILY